MASTVAAVADSPPRVRIYHGTVHRCAQSAKESHKVRIEEQRRVHPEDGAVRGVVFVCVGNPAGVRQSDGGRRRPARAAPTARRPAPGAARRTRAELQPIRGDEERAVDDRLQRGGKSVEAHAPCDDVQHAFPRSLRRRRCIVLDGSTGVARVLEKAAREHDRQSDELVAMSRHCGVGYGAAFAAQRRAERTVFTCRSVGR